MPSHRLSPAALRRQISEGALDPLYVIFGDDEAEKTALAAAFGAAVEEEFRAFNLERVYGGEPRSSLAGVVDSARTMPWITGRRIILVLQAERLLAPKQESDEAERDLSEFERYVRAPEPHATVVLIAAGLDKRRRLVTLLMKQATIVECAGPENAGGAAAWVRGRVAEEGAKIDVGAVRLLVDRAGTDIGRLRADVDRVLMYVAGERPITAADVDEVSGARSLQDEWGMARAIEQGSPGTALRELALMLDSGISPLQILGQIAWVVRTEPPRGSFPGSRLAQAVEALFRVDLAIKTSAGDPRLLLERLIVELCGTAKPTAGSRPSAPKGEDTGRATRP
jgi:DNA polymerase-3 subunit delta